MNAFVDWLYSLSPTYAPWLLLIMFVLIWFGPEFWSYQKHRNKTELYVTAFSFVIFVIVWFVGVLQPHG